jgi:hypothetical protein
MDWIWRGHLLLLLLRQQLPFVISLLYQAEVQHLEEALKEIEKCIGRSRGEGGGNVSDLNNGLQTLTKGKEIWIGIDGISKTIRSFL